MLILYADLMRLLVAGDSITRGANASDGLGWRGKLTTLVQSVAGMQLDVISYAAGGWSTADANPGWGAAILSTSPDAVLICLGTNDTGDVAGFETRFEKMLGAATDLQAGKIFVSFVQYSSGPHVSLATGEAAVNDAIWRVASARGYWSATPPVRYGGLADFQVVPAAYSDSQGVHPTDAGYGVYSRLIYDALRKAYGWPAYPYTENPPLTGHRPTAKR